MRKVLYILGELRGLGSSVDVGCRFTAARGRRYRDHPRGYGSGQSLHRRRRGAVGQQVGASRSPGWVPARSSATCPCSIRGRPAATVAAMADSTLFAIPQEALRSKLKTDTGFAARFYRALCIFLANRLSRTGLMVNATARTPAEMTEDQDEEISPDALETLALAGARFDWFLQRVPGQVGEGRDE